MKISPSLMCMDLWSIQEQISFLDKHADFLHIDVFDGHYAKNFCFGPEFVRQLRPHTTLPLDVHLCVESPQDFIETFTRCGADIISVHADVIMRDAFRVLATIQSAGAKTGVVINPAVPLRMIDPYIHLIDKLTIMTIDVGFAGQQLIPQTLDKLRRAVSLKREGGHRYLVEADGQCNAKNFKDLKETGLDIMIVGTSGLFSLDASISRAWEIMGEQIQNA